MIKEVGIVVIGTRWSGCNLGTLRAVVPLPVNSDTCLSKAEHHDFADMDKSWYSELVRTILQAIGGTFKVVAPLRSTPSFWDHLRRFLTFRRAIQPHDPNPNRLEAVEALCSAARDDSCLAFASVYHHRASIETSGDHPILWIWTSIDDTTWNKVENCIAQMKLTRVLALDSSSLSLTPPKCYHEESVVVHAASNSVLWTDGVRVLGLDGEFLFPHPGNIGCEDPRMVYLPFEDEWVRSAPDWARTSYADLVHSLEIIGLRVVRRQGAVIHARK